MNATAGEARTQWGLPLVLTVREVSHSISVKDVLVLSATSSRTLSFPQISVLANKYMYL